MEEKIFVDVRKNEYNVKQFVKRMFGMGKVSSVKIEYTPVGEKIIVSTHKPGLIIGKKGEKIIELTNVLKRRFKMENPHIDVDEVLKPEFDARLVADDIALTLERFGAMKYKSVSYRYLSRIKAAGAKGAELRVSGKLPSDRARVWRFTFGYLKKTGEPAKLVDRAESVAVTKQGVVGIKVSILSPDVKMDDQIDVNDELVNAIKKNLIMADEVKEPVKKKTRKKVVKKTVKKATASKTKKTNEDKKE